MSGPVEAGPIQRQAFVVMRQEDERVAVLRSDSPQSIDPHARPWTVVAEPPHLPALADVDNRQYPTLRVAKRAVIDALDATVEIPRPPDPVETRS